MTNKTLSQSNFFSTIKVGGWTLVSRIAGLIRDIFTTNLLGASFFHDIFVVVLKIPNVFRKFFAEGAFSQAFIPIYSEYLGKNDEKGGQEFLNSLLGILLTALFIFTSLALLFAPIFILIFAPGFYFDSQKQELAVSLLRIMFPYLALISLVAFAAGIQNSHDKFSIPAITPLIFNLCLIVSAWLIAPNVEIPVIALAWGVLLAGVLQLIFQLAPLAAIKKIPLPKVNLNNLGVKKFFILIGSFFPSVSTPDETSKANGLKFSISSEILPVVSPPEVKTFVVLIIFFKEFQSNFSPVPPLSLIHISEPTRPERI